MEYLTNVEEWTPWKFIGLVVKLLAGENLVPFIPFIVSAFIFGYLFLSYLMLVKRNDIDFWNKLSYFDKLFYSFLVGGFSILVSLIILATLNFSMIFFNSKLFSNDSEFIISALFLSIFYLTTILSKIESREGLQFVVPYTRFSVLIMAVFIAIFFQVLLIYAGLKGNMGLREWVPVIILYALLIKHGKDILKGLSDFLK